MAVYDFVCVDCGLVEITKAMHEPNPIVCPRCKRPGLIRRFTPISKIMRGDHYVSSRSPGFGKIPGGEVTPRTLTG